MRRALLILLIVFFIVNPWERAWAGPTARELLSLLPLTSAEAEYLTRADFAVMLARAANVKIDKKSNIELPEDVPKDSWYVGAVSALWQKGIIRGFPNGTLRPLQEINSLEAVIITARAMGVPNEITGPSITLFDARYIPYGLDQYAFFYHQGLLPPGKPLESMKPEETAVWLAEIFSSNPEAENLLKKSIATVVREVAMENSGEMIIKFYSRSGLPFAADLDRLTIKGTLHNKYVLPGQIHQVIGMQVEKDNTMQIEQVIDGGSLYRKTTDSTGRSEGWQKLNISPNPAALIREQQNLGIPAAVLPALKCRYLGERTHDGRKVTVISFYARVENLNELSGYLPATAVTGGFDDYLNLPGNPFDSVSYWGRVFIDSESRLPVMSDFNLMLVFAQEYQGQPVPMAAIEVQYKTEMYGFDGVSITMPEVVPVS